MSAIDSTETENALNTKDSLRSHRQSFHFSFASKADANSTLEGLRAIRWKVPQTDPCTAAKAKRYSITSSARAQERDWNGKAERLGGLEVEEQLDFSGLLNRQVGRLIAFENPAGVDACCPECVRKTASIAHQAAGRGELTN